MTVKGVFKLKSSLFNAPLKIRGSIVILRNSLLKNSNGSVFFSSKEIKIDCCCVSNFNTNSHSCSFKLHISEFSHISNCHIINCHSTENCVMVLAYGSHHLDSLNISYCSSRHISSIDILHCDSYSKFLNIFNTSASEEGVCIQAQNISTISSYIFCNVLDNICPYTYGLFRNVESVGVMTVERCSIFGNVCPFCFHGESMIFVKMCNFDDCSITLSVQIDIHKITERTEYSIIINSPIICSMKLQNRSSVIPFFFVLFRSPS